MWPEIPDNLEGLSSTELRGLAKKVRAARKTVAAEKPNMSAEEHDEWTQMGVVAARLGALADDAEVDEREAAAEAQAAADKEAADKAAAEAEEQEAADKAAADESDDDPVDDDEPTEDADEHSAPLPTGLSIETTPTPAVERAGRWLSTGLVKVADDGTELPGRNESFSDMRQLAVALSELGGQVDAGDTTKHKVARMPARFREGADLDANPFFNLDRFNFRDESELTAAMCAPLTPLYDLSCANATRRPVANGLPNFRLRADRGGFSVYPSPSLADITGGYGQWTSTDDADLEAIKAACQTITCSTPTEYEIYGVYRCLTVKNLVNMTFPEIVEAYLNRLEAAWARYAETLLLEAMGNGSTTIDAPAQGFGAGTSLKRIVLTYLGLYQEIERWDVPMMDAWMPRWLLFALKMDEVSRRRTDGGQNRVPSDEEVNGWFRDCGVEPHWYMDRPSWATPVPTLATSGDLNFFPSSVEILIHKRGKFAYMDRGELTVGVSGNNIYRKEDDLRRNQFTFFFESFEGLIDTDSCPAHILQVPGLCYNGAQIADTVIECEGQNVVGVGS